MTRTRTPAPVTAGQLPLRELDTTSTVAPRSVSAHHRDLLRRAGAPDHHRWLAHTATTRGCVRPVRLTGQLHTVEKATGRILDTRHTVSAMPDGVLYVPCGDRRASICPPCAETYRADTYQLIKAGLAGGKGVPSSVASHPAVFNPKDRKQASRASSSPNTAASSASSNVRRRSSSVAHAARSRSSTAPGSRPAT